jgi:hypothetical protein
MAGYNPADVLLISNDQFPEAIHLSAYDPADDLVVR